ncbi:hypothetical protein [Paraflavitalea sp. CAU 1676]|uniref:hypothetical protein n=1 Tax=Paraflavitalea sp. CAU 1676 TaxID=3032598 RepID=UPI0023D9B4C4|nr:hypothetical protein [Paraflavitalea sp. CAU 1676]MDF2190541.1 hypothetical protein [Paraflavitalea sp. CAU 1676]
MSMEVWELIQENSLGGGLYNKDVIIKALEQASLDEFSKFCREYLHLLEFYNSNLNASATDEKYFRQKFPEHFWQLKPIDFDAPLNFLQI